MTENNVFASRRTMVSLRNLYLDPNNFRLIGEPGYQPVPEERIKEKTETRRTFRLLAGEKNQHLQDLVDSFTSNGFLPVDQIQVRELPDGGYLVVEGNRRVAALKHLQFRHETQGFDLGRLSERIFSAVPVVIYDDPDEMHYLTLMGLKHISGNRKWAEWNQAKLLQKMHESHQLSEDEICRRIAISKVELRRSLRALSFARQYQDSDYGEQFEESKFPLFREATRNAALKNWLDWDDQRYEATNTENMEFFFSWISREPIEEDTEDGSSDFGDGYHPPAIHRREDVRLLGQMIGDEKAIRQLKATRDINAAYRSSDLVFQERQEAAIHSVSNEISTLSQMAVRGEYLPELEESLGRLRSIVEKTRATDFPGIEQTDVFHDRIDSHFSSIFIEKYKVFQSFEWTRLARINLLAGLNNSGKTSLLEAIFLLCRQNDFSGLLEVVRRRGKVPRDKLAPEWFVDQLPPAIQAGGRFDDMEAEISIRHFLEEKEDIDKSRYLKTVEITSRYGEQKQESRTRLFQGRDRETQAERIRLLCPSVFSSPFFLNEPHRYTEFYHKSVQSKALPKIIEFIRKHIRPSISDVRLVDERQRFLVIDEEFGNALDLTEYGEGVQRIFFISLLFASAANGVVLVDEFENAIHTALIPRFVEFIGQLAESFNVQVFLTSHSKECIDAFVANIPSADDFSACALVEGEGGIVGRQFGGKEFKRLVNAGNVDLRRAR